jgi:hypothetical protein
LRHLPPVIVSLKKRRKATTQFLFRTFSGTGALLNYGGTT